MDQEHEDNGKIIKVCDEFLEIIEDLREIIEKSTSGGLGGNLSYPQLTRILAIKLKKANLTFTFP